MSDSVQLKPRPILDPDSSSLKSLAITLGVMCFLACLAVAGLLTVNQAIRNWNKGLASEITVQIRPTAGSDIEASLRVATDILKKSAGIKSVTTIDRAESIKMLEPWLGKADVEDLPIPRLIRVVIDQAQPPDLNDLEQQLSHQINGIVLDTHSRWQTELSRAGQAIGSLTIAILIVIAGGAAMLIVFAARAALDANREIVEILRLIGAQNHFIADQINLRFLKGGLVASLAGCGAAFLLLFAVDWLARHNHVGLDASVNLLISIPTMFSVVNLPYFLAVPIMSVLIVWISAKVTLSRLLVKM